MPARKKQRKSIFVRLLALGVSAYFIFSLSNLWHTLQKSRAELNALQTQYRSEQNDIEELKRLLDDDSKAKVIEKAARERLGYVFSDEEIYVDISGN
ncbi:MAG: septum formation initiator family protein [Clostridia bacterium]|nr:septum formation initiator family protein [Clostridia bacterium]